MNAQTVVDTFAPFVGTEGLRDVVSISVHDRHEIALSVGTETQGRTDVVRPHIAHGFLPSRLAEGLAEKGWLIRRGEIRDCGPQFLSSQSAHECHRSDDYSSAILAAARVEWPKREPEQPQTPSRMIFQGHFRCEEYHTAPDGTIVVTKATITDGSVSYP